MEDKKIMSEVNTHDFTTEQDLARHQRWLEDLNIRYKEITAVHNNFKAKVAKYFALEKNPYKNAQSNELKPYIEWANELLMIEAEILNEIKGFIQDEE